MNVGLPVVNEEITMPYPNKIIWALISKHRISFSIMLTCFYAVQLLTKFYWYSIVILPKSGHANCSFVSFDFDYYTGYKVIKKIGEGTFSDVVKTQSLKDGKFYACKTMKQTINRYVFCNKRPAHRQQSVVHLYHSLLCMDPWNLRQQLDTPFA